MIDSKYKKAYTEVLEVINKLSPEEYNKIPKEKIEYYTKNADKYYYFEIDPTIPIERQKLSKEANAILVSLFLDYFVNDIQRKGLQEMLDKNEEASNK